MSSGFTPVATANPTKMIAINANITIEVANSRVIVTSQCKWDSVVECEWVASL